MNDSALDILAGTFKSQDTIAALDVYTFESKITVLDKYIGAGCPVHVFKKTDGTLIYTTETDIDSTVYVPNLFKDTKYFVVATDVNDLYNSVIFDLNWDFAERAAKKYNLNHFNKQPEKSLKNLYPYVDSYSNTVYDQDLMYSIAAPLNREVQGAVWLTAGDLNIDVIEGFQTFLFKGVSSTYTYIKYLPLYPKQSWTVEMYLKPLKLPSGQTLAGTIFAQGSQGLFINADGSLVFKTETVTMESESILEFGRLVHIAVTCDKESLHLYVDGSLVNLQAARSGFKYMNGIFSIGAGFYGHLANFTIFKSVKYSEDFQPSITPINYQAVVYNEKDIYQNQTVLKTAVDNTGYLTDIASNIPLTFNYTVPANSYIASNDSFISTPAAYRRLVLSNDFTIEAKFRLLNRVGNIPVLFGNKSTKEEWVPGTWQLCVDHPSYAEKYALTVYGVTSPNIVALYPVIYNEPVSMVLQRRGNIWSYYFNGYLDKSITWESGATFDTKLASFFSLGGGVNLELFDLKVSQAARYNDNYIDTPLSVLNNSIVTEAYYKILNYDFKKSLFDFRSALRFVNTGVILSSKRSSYKTKSAKFSPSSYFVSTSQLWYTPNENFTVEFKISVESLPLTKTSFENDKETVVDVAAILFGLYKASSVKLQVGILNSHLAIFDGTKWTKSNFEFTSLLDFKHIVVQRQDTSLKLLAEGSLVLEITTPSLDGRLNVSIGADLQGDQSFNGYMNNLYAYKNYSKYQDIYEVPVDPDESVTVEDQEKEPKVIVTPYTTSALDFENGLKDQVGSTIWQKEGTANITSTSKIFGESSFETKALGDSLYTNSNIITGGSTPFTIEFYALIKDIQANGNATIYSQNKSIGAGSQYLGLKLDSGYKPFFDRQVNNGVSPFNVTGNTNIKLNDINKFTTTYDGSALRLFINNKLDIVVGTSSGWNINSLPFEFLNWNIPGYESYRTYTKGIIDNINIHNGIATKVRDYDPYEEFLVVDLAFDGENNSTKIVDNGTLKSTWTVNGGAKLSTTQKFDGFSSLYIPYSNNDRYVTSRSDIIFENGEDFTFSFEFIRLPSTVTFATIFTSGVSNVPNSNNVWSINAFSSYYNNASFSVLRNKVSFVNEKNFNKNEDGLVSNTIIQDNVKYKVDIVRNGITTFLYINNVLDSATDVFQNERIDFSNLCIGTPMWSNGREAGISCYLKNVKVYKGVAVIPESPVGKIQLDFDNNLVDKYGNSTWTNNGVTFDQVNSVKGYAAYFNGNSRLTTNLNDNLNFGKNNFKLSMDFNLTNFVGWNTFITSYASGVGGSTISYNNTSNITRVRLDFNNYLDFPSYHVLNSYYNICQTRVGDSLLYKINDVVQSCFNTSLPLNHNSNSKTTISGVDYSYSESIKGYIDNFKSIKDYKGEVIIDKPAVHLPLETNAINIGFTPLTINSVGNPTYTTIDGKKCIKFERGKYLSINSNNIFNLGTNSDFYIEFELYITTLENGMFLISSMSLWTSPNDVCYLHISTKGELTYYHTNNSTVIFSKKSNENVILVNQWQKIIFKRTNGICSISINNTNILDFTSLVDISNGGTSIGANSNPADVAGYIRGYMSNFKMFVGTSEIPETYNDKKVLDLDFKPTGKSYLFKDNNNKCVIHPVNITQRDYQDSEYCCYFNGTNQYISLGKNDLLNFGKDDFVLNFKIKPKFSSNSNHRFSRILAPRKDIILNEYIMLPGENYSLPNYRGTVMVVLDESTSVFMHTPRLSESEINNITLVRSGNVFSLYLNDILTEEKTFVGDFNLNRNGETIIGASKDSSEVVSYLNATLYSIKVLRNTSDLSLLVDKVKRPPVDTIP